MTAKQNRTTKTANTGAPASAKEKAANKATEIRPEVQKLITSIRKAATTLSNTVYKAAMQARELQVTEDENKALLREIPKQRRADYRRITEAPAEHLDDKMPTNLVKGARYLQLRAKGHGSQLAADIVAGKATDPDKQKGRQSRPEERNGQKGTTPSAEAGPASDGPGSAAAGQLTDTAPGSNTGGLALIQKGIEQLREEYPNDATIGKALRALEHAAGTIGDHIAKLDANQKAKKGKAGKAA